MELKFNHEAETFSGSIGLKTEQFKGAVDKHIELWNSSKSKSEFLQKVCKDCTDSEIAATLCFLLTDYSLMESKINRVEESLETLKSLLK